MTTEPSEKFIQASLERASEALTGAKILLQQGELHGAVSRAYYCAFHAATAVLHSRGIRAKTHSGLRSLFGGHIVKPGIMDKQFSDILRDIFVARQLSDYEVYAEFKLDEVESLVSQAELFLKAAKDLLKYK